jgi:hypothetical protein
MITREERLPELTGLCPCGGEVVLITSVNNKEGCVADGDDAICTRCGKKGCFCGAPSDGIGVDWEFYSN